MDHPRCPLCQQPGAVLLLEEPARRYHHCARCDLRFLHPACRLPRKAERERYLLHQNDVADPGYRRFATPLRDCVMERVPRGALGLDFGAGPGPVLAELLREQSYRVELYDPFFHPRLTALERRYAFAVACEVLEHLYDPRAELERLRRLLKPGGLLAIMTQRWTDGVDFERWTYRRDPTHVAFYSQTSFLWIASELGFEPPEFGGPRVVSLRVGDRDVPVPPSGQRSRFFEGGVS